MRVTLTLRTIMVAGAACLAVACSEDVPQETGDDAARTAEGEVLGGSISDDMLPLDQVTSQSPPLRGEGTSSASTGGTGETDAAVDGGEADAAPEPATPEPGPEPATDEG